MTGPNYAGRGLVNLVAELEARLGGEPPTARLAPEVADAIPDADSYVLVVFDGMGAGQLAHPSAASLAEDVRGTLDAPFPTTTTVGLATIATGLPPSQHGLLGYQLFLPEHQLVANTIKWTTLWGDPLEIQTEAFLPQPNLWERLTAIGREPITVQPGNFANSPLSKALYRGCRFEPVFNQSELVSAAVELAAGPGRLILVYVPHVDFAAHMYGQESAAYREAIREAVSVWEGIRHGLPTRAVAVAAADHGHVDIPGQHQIRIEKSREAGLILYGDSRVMFVRGDGEALAGDLPAQWVPISEMGHWWGPGPHHPDFEQRAPDGVLVVDPDYALLHSHSDKRLIGQHGGLSEAELQVPLLVAD